MIPATARDVRDRTIALVRRAVQPEARITNRTHIVADLGLESVQILELVVEIEREFDISIDEGEIAPIRTIGDLVAAITERLDDRPRG